MFKPNLACEPNGVLTFPKLASPKLDGIRCVTKFGDALSRSLKPIPNHYIREKLANFQNLDGEIIVGSVTAPDVYRVTNSGVMSQEGEPDFVYYVFDNPSMPADFQARYESIRLSLFPKFIKVLPQTLINSQGELDTYYGDLLSLGYEGAILRNLSAKYKHGRSTALSQDMLKLKPFADSEAVVVSAYEAMFNGNESFTNELGHTDRSTAAAGLIGKGMVGGFVVQDLTTGVVFDCAAGRSTHEERKEWWKNPPVGKILKYRYMPIGIKDKPRFPRFIGWRSSIDM